MHPLMRRLLGTMVHEHASDLHITVGAPPTLRVFGELIRTEAKELSPADTQELCYSLINEEQREKFEREWELDFSIDVPGLARFRANLFVQRGHIAGAFRTIAASVPTLQELGLPSILAELARRPRGLILVTGPTGSGKSTTLASMIDQLNREQAVHILTVEDPIEYIHPHRRAIVNQREVGTDTRTFGAALKYVLREDPDVVLIGELRDMETIEAALNVSETGHLVLATLHTNSAVQTLGRLTDVFPAHQRSYVRSQLAFVLEGIVSQLLLPTSDGNGRVPSCEVLVPTPAVRNLIREEKTHQIYSQMQINQASTGMQTMNQSLFDLLESQRITLDTAMAVSGEPGELHAMIQARSRTGSRSSATSPARR
jgi:twitching motility protein PilT